jgi:hypothetical protein
MIEKICLEIIEFGQYTNFEFIPLESSILAWWKIYEGGSTPVVKSWRTSSLLYY